VPSSTDAPSRRVPVKYVKKLYSRIVRKPEENLPVRYKFENKDED
jgi:hypothetical protein